MAVRASSTPQQIMPIAMAVDRLIRLAKSRWQWTESM
jgi:hypothetical protein